MSSSRVRSAPSARAIVESFLIELSRSWNGVVFIYGSQRGPLFELPARLRSAARRSAPRSGRGCRRPLASSFFRERRRTRGECAGVIRDCRERGFAHVPDENYFAD